MFHHGSLPRRPARARRRTAARPSVEAMESRQLLSVLDTLDTALDASWEAASLTRNALQAYQIAYDFGQDKDAKALQDRQTVDAEVDPILGPTWDELWSLIDQARPLILQAADAFEQARRTPSPGQGELVDRGNALIKQASPLAQKAVSDWFTLQGIALAYRREHPPSEPVAPPEPPPQPPPPVETSPPPTVIVDNPPAPLPPFQIGLVENGYPDEAGNITLSGGARANVTPGGGPPVEANVDWSTWYYQKLIPAVKTKVFDPNVGAFNGVRDRLQVTLTYEIFKDGRTVAVVSRVEGTGVAGEPQRTFNNNLTLWARNAKNLMPGLGLPLPSNTKMPSLIRTFTFTLNGGGPVMQLVGPPKEVSTPGSHLDPRSGLKVQQIRTARPRGPELALARGVRRLRPGIA